MIKNAFSVDLESFIHRQLDFKKRTVKDKGKTVRAIKYLLDLFDFYKTKVTFFVVGEIFDWYPKLIEEIQNHGHEIAYHGHHHLILKDKKILLDDLSLSRKFIKKFRPVGFRAPRMFLKKECLSVLKDFGFQYDSSTYGTRFEVKSGLKELPVSIWIYPWIRFSGNIDGGLKTKIFLQGIPFGSGLLLSVFGKKIQYFIDLVNRQGQPAIIFVHPWQFYDYEIDLLQERSFLVKFFYRRKINQIVEFLLSMNKFVPLKEFL